MMTSAAHEQRAFAALLRDERIDVRIEPTCASPQMTTTGRGLLIPSIPTDNPDIWSVYVAHAVAHAQWTPHGYPQAPSAWVDRYGAWATEVVHRCEDIRVYHRLIRQYPGLRSRTTRVSRMQYDPDTMTHPLHRIYWSILCEHDCQASPDDMAWTMSMTTTHTYEDVLRVAAAWLAAYPSGPVTPDDAWFIVPASMRLAAPPPKVTPTTTRTWIKDQTQWPPVEWTHDALLAQWTPTPEQRAWVTDCHRHLRAQAAPTLQSMAQTFQRHQRAPEWAQGEYRRTGELDTDALWRLPFADTICRRREMQYRGQHHGLVITVDWSASMIPVLPSVLWQLMHYIWWAELVGIPCCVMGYSGLAPAVPSSGVMTYPSACALLPWYDSRHPQTTRASMDMLVGLFAAAWQIAPQGRPQVLCDLMARLPAWSPLTPDQFGGVFCAGPTVLHTAIGSMSDVVQRFRQTTGVDQCLSVWITDGVNTAPCTGWQSSPLRMRPRDVLVDPIHGTFRPVGIPTDAVGQLWAWYRAKTDATVVVIDITATPAESYARVVGKAMLREAGLSRDTFPAIHHIDRAILPALPVDAYCTTHPGWWTGSRGRLSVTPLRPDLPYLTPAEYAYHQHLTDAETMRQWMNTVIPYLAQGSVPV
jgi:hypothetical protein